MAKTLRIDDNKARYIDNNHREKTVSEMSAVIHVPVRDIYEFMGDRGMETLDRTKKKKNVVSDGMFNEKESNNWLIG
jgi:hypothetical protein